MITDNVRVADLVVGDMDAQIAACHVGARRLLDLVERYGLTTLTSRDRRPVRLFRAPDALADRQAHRTAPTARRLHRRLSGQRGCRRHEPADQASRVTVSGSDLTIDLTGTAPQVAGHAINMPFVGTVDVALWLTLRSILLDSDVTATFHRMTACTAPVTIVAPRGCIANPIFPAPTIARFCTRATSLADTLMQRPGTGRAGAGLARAWPISRRCLQRLRRRAALGAHRDLRGQLWRALARTVSTRRHALRQHAQQPDRGHRVPCAAASDRYELREDAGAGQWRGGFGSMREFVYLSDGGASVEGEGHRYRPWGFDGGEAGKISSLDVLGADGNQRSLPSKVPYTRMRKGDRMIAIGPCGGGYALPLCGTRCSSAAMSPMASCRSKTRAACFRSCCSPDRNSTTWRQRRCASGRLDRESEASTGALAPQKHVERPFPAMPNTSRRMRKNEAG